MGRTKEELDRKKAFRDLTSHVYKEARITYQGQADAIGMPYSRMQGIRSAKDLRYIPKEEEIAVVKETFREELAGFGEPSPVDRELAALRAELESLREKVGKKESLNEQLQEMLIEAQRRIKELGG